MVSLKFVLSNPPTLLTDLVWRYRSDVEFPVYGGFPHTTRAAREVEVQEVLQELLLLFRLQYFLHYWGPQFSDVHAFRVFCWQQFPESIHAYECQWFQLTLPCCSRTEEGGTSPTMTMTITNTTICLFTPLGKEDIWDKEVLLGKGFGASD